MLIINNLQRTIAETDHTMKALIINGSPHKNGNTSIALAEIAKVLNSKGIETETVWIGNRPVRGCIACGKCFEMPGRCAFDDDVCNRISEKFKDIDALVVGSPVYYGQPNGALLAVLQRAFFSNTANITGKPAVSVAVCRRGGASAAYATLNMPWNMVYGQTPGQAAQDEEGMQTMRTLGNNLAFLLHKTGGQRAPGLPEGEDWTPTHFIR